MNDLLETVSDYKLTDLLSAAGATIGVIIAGTIFRQFLSGKYLEIMTRYRSLTGEYRGSEDGAARHGHLQTQIRSYRRRLRIISWASVLSAVALLFFLASVLAGGLSMVWPALTVIKGVGTVGLVLGLMLIGFGVMLDLVESFLALPEVTYEAEDLDEPAKRAT